MRPLHVGVVGSRDFVSPRRVREVVMGLAEEFRPAEVVVVSGGARGVDTWAEQAALAAGYRTVILPARWEEVGRGAGFLRNQEIVDLSDRLYAFWNGRSRGTRDTIVRALRKAITVRVYRSDGAIFRPSTEAALDREFASAGSDETKSMPRR